jgi:hypothetical protein
MTGKEEKQIELSVIATHHRTPELLKLFLESLKAAATDLRLEIIVVDSEAEEETGEFLASDFPEIIYLPFKENTGYAKLVNAGLNRARGEYLLVLNADIILVSGALEKMLQYMKENFTAGMLGPQLLNFNGSRQESCFRWYRPLTILYRRTWLGKTAAGKKDLARFLMKDQDLARPQAVDWLLGAAMFFRRAAFSSVGPMDERFFMYFEDVDWCRRFHQHGWQVVYLPDAKIYHYHGKVSKTENFWSHFFNKYFWIHLSSAFKYFLKHGWSIPKS